MNGVIHNSTHGNSGAAESVLGNPEYTKENIRINMCKRLDLLVESVHPTHLVYIALDGVPPRAKANEQRKRRFRSAKDAKDALFKKDANNNTTASQPLLPSPDAFDPNSISPATEFMESVNTWVRDYATALSARYPGLAVVVSDSTVPGEGEHKIMDFIRANMALWADDTSHCFYGMDADLLFLGLATHAKHFFVLRDHQNLISCGICRASGHMSYECPSALAVKKRLAFEKSTQVVVRNVPPAAADEATLRSIFEYFGEIVSIRMERALTKKPTVTAYIEFSEVAPTEELTGRGAVFYINDHKVSIFNIPPTTSNVVIADTSSPSTDSPPTEDLVEPVVDEGIPDNTLFLPNLNLQTTAFDVEAFFASCGSIESVNFIPSPRFPKLKFALVKFKDLDAAKLGLAMDGSQFFGSTVLIKKSRQGPATPQPATEVKETAEQKLAREKLKEQRKIEKEVKVTTFIAMAEPDTTHDTAYFYLGLGGWDLDKSYQIYLDYGKAQFKMENGEPQQREYDDQFDFVNLDYLRDYLRHYMLFGLDKYNVDFNRCVNDFTLMCMLLGNDFLPHLPSMNIKDGSIELVLCWYKEWIKSTTLAGETKYITDGSNIVYSNFHQLLIMIEKWEAVLYPDKFEKMYKKDQLRLATLIEDKRKSGNVEEEARLSAKLKNLNEGEWNYYKLKLDATSQDKVKEVCDAMCRDYLDGLTWVLRYYTVGCPSWSWSYQYHYAPLAKDFRKFIGLLAESADKGTSEVVKFDVGAPLDPLVHLVSVLPRFSAKCLPEKLAEIMNEPSPLAKFYRENFRIDLNGADVQWKGIVLLEFIDVELLKQVTEPIIKQLDQVSLDRNVHGVDVYLLNKKVHSIDEYVAAHKTAEENVVAGSHGVEIEEFYQKLVQRDLLWSTRRYFTSSPLPTDAYALMPQATTAQTVQTSTLPTENVISSDQARYLQWREKQSQANGNTPSVLGDIDLSQCQLVGADAKNSSNIARLLSNEISSEKKIHATSLVDDQMIIQIGFKTQVKLNGIKFISTISKESIPKNIKIYINESSIDFSNVTGMTPKLEFTLNSATECDIDSSFLPFASLRLKSLSTITIFIESNQGGQDHKTIIEKIILFSARTKGLILFDFKCLITNFIVIAVSVWAASCLGFQCLGLVAR
eukprot:gene5643-6512_t